MGELLGKSMLLSRMRSIPALGSDKIPRRVSVHYHPKVRRQCYATALRWSAYEH